MPVLPKSHLLVQNRSNKKVKLNTKFPLTFCEDFHNDLTLVPVHYILYICVDFVKLEVHEGLDTRQRALDVVVGHAREQLVHVRQQFLPLHVVIPEKRMSQLVFHNL